MDAIQLIRRDHRAVEQLFTRFERAEREGRLDEVRGTVRELIRELSVHAAIEEQLLYPALREAGVEDGTLQALEEHHVVKVTLAELEAMDVRDERFTPKVRLLVGSVRAHVEEEEQELLPALQRAFDAARLRELGQALRQAKRLAPTRPHPAAPDTPPGNLVAGTLAALIDRSRDAIRGGAEMLWSMASRRGRRTRRELRDRGQQAMDETRAATASFLDRGEEVAERVRERGRAAAIRADQGARRVQEGVQAVAREVRSRGGAARAGVRRRKQARPASARGRPRRKPARGR